MLQFQKRDEILVELGFKPLKGRIRVHKSFKKETTITSLSINLKNIFSTDIDFIISELEKQKELLNSEYKNSLKCLKI